MTETTNHKGRGQEVHNSGQRSPEPLPDEVDSAAPRALDELSRVVEKIVRVSGCLPRQVSVRLAGASIEVEWAQNGDPEEPGAAVSEVLDPGPSAIPSVPEGDRQSTHAEESIHVNSPLVGTFYHSPEPGAPPFVVVGQDVDSGQQVGIVEAMKLMIPVVSENSGRVARILVSDAERVEYDQPLLLIGQEDTA